MAATFSNSPGLSLEEKHWYAGFISERKAEGILTKIGQVGSFLVRGSLLPDADYVLSVNNGGEIRHYDITALSSDGYVINKYMFPGICEVVAFYMENRLDNVYLEEPEEPVISEIEKVSSTRVKMAPLSASPTKTRVVPISTQNTNGHRESMKANGELLRGSFTQLNNDCNQTAPGEVLAISVPHCSHSRDSFVESDASKEAHEAMPQKGEFKEAWVNVAHDGSVRIEMNVPYPQQQRNRMGISCTASNECIENTSGIDYSYDEQPTNSQIHTRTSSMSVIPRHDSHVAYGHTKLRATDTLDMHFRRRSTGSALRRKTKEEQLEELNHLPSIKTKCHILQQRIEGDYEDSDSDADDDKELAPVLVIENQSASLQIEPAASASDDDILSTFRPCIPRQIKPEKSPWGIVNYIAPIAASPIQNKYVRARSNSDSFRSGPLPRQKPVIPKRQDIPEKDCMNDEVDADMPPPPPLSTHPGVIARKKKRQSAALGTARQRGESGEAGQTSEDQDEVFESLWLAASTNSFRSADLIDGQNLNTAQQNTHINTRRESFGIKKRSFFRRK